MTYSRSRQIASAKPPVLLEEIVASNDATVEFTSLISSAYEVYELEILNWSAVTDVVQPRMYLSGDNGSTWYSSYATAGHAGREDAGSSPKGINNSAYLNLNFYNSQGADGAGESWSGTMRFLEPENASYRNKGHAIGVQYNANSYQEAGYFGFALDTNPGAVNAIKFEQSSGNISSGTFRLFGIPK